MWYTALKNLSKLFSWTLVQLRSRSAGWVVERHNYPLQEPHGGKRTVLQHDVMVSASEPQRQRLPKLIPDSRPSATQLTVGREQLQC